MALIHCPECKEKISDKAPVCPKCGIPIRTAADCRIDVDAGHAALAFFYNALMTNININEKSYQRPWGLHSFKAPAGNYEVSVSYPWILSPNCGKNTVSFTLESGDAIKVTYRAGMIRYLPGTIYAEKIPYTEPSAEEIVRKETEKTDTQAVISAGKQKVGRKNPISMSPEDADRIPEDGITTECPGCGSNVPANLKNCIVCGRPIQDFKDENPKRIRRNNFLVGFTYGLIAEAVFGLFLVIFPKLADGNVAGFINATMAALIGVFGCFKYNKVSEIAGLLAGGIAGIIIGFTLLPVLTGKYPLHDFKFRMK
jgi:hypothetical protein